MPPKPRNDERAHNESIKPDAVLTMRCSTCGAPLTDPRMTQCDECFAKRLKEIIDRALYREFGH